MLRVREGGTNTTTVMEELEIEARAKTLRIATPGAFVAIDSSVPIHACIYMSYTAEMRSGVWPKGCWQILYHSGSGCLLAKQTASSAHWS